MTKPDRREPHVHEAISTSMTKTTTWQVCSCGASRSCLIGRDITKQGWHTCEKCTHPWGMPGAHDEQA